MGSLKVALPSRDQLLHEIPFRPTQFPIVDFVSGAGRLMINDPEWYNRFHF